MWGDETRPRGNVNVHEAEPPEDVLGCPFSHTCLTILWPQHASAPVTAGCVLTSRTRHHVARCKLLHDQEELRGSSSCREPPRVPHSRGGRSSVIHFLTHQISRWYWGETLSPASIFSPLLLSAELNWPVKFFFFPINYPSQLKFFPQHSLFLLVLANMYEHEISTAHSGKISLHFNYVWRRWSSPLLMIQSGLCKEWNREILSQRKSRDWNP